MNFKNLLFLTVLTLFSYNINAQLLSNPKIGLGTSYGGSSIGLMAELSVGADLSKHFTLNLRYASNGDFLNRIGGGVEYKPLTLGRFTPSIGLEYFYNTEDSTFFGDSETQNFSNIDVPIMLNYKVSNRFDICLGGILGSNESTSFTIRLNAFYFF